MIDTDSLFPHSPGQDVQQPVQWTALEAAFATTPRRGLIEFLARAVRRIEPLVAEAADVYGPESIEWLHAVRSVTATVEAFASPITLPKVTRFTLDLAAEIARGTAAAAANVARQLGPSRAGEQAELVFASAAFLADTARTPSRSAAFAIRCARNADATGMIPRVLWAADWNMLMSTEPATPAEARLALSPLWPDGEPDWWIEGLSRWRAGAAQLPTILLAIHDSAGS